MVMVLALCWIWLSVPRSSRSKGCQGQSGYAWLSHKQSIKSFYNMYKRCPRIDSTLAIYRSPFYDVIISHAREVQFICNGRNNCATVISLFWFQASQCCCFWPDVLIRAFAMEQIHLVEKRNTMLFGTNPFRVFPAEKYIVGLYKWSGAVSQSH